MSANSTISHEIANLLRDEILRSQYRRGERLPSERDLAARFDASRGAVREALSQLEQLGLIRILPGGARIQAIDAASIAILGPLMAVNDLPDPLLVDQFLQTFGVLTALTARTAINKASNEEMQDLQGMVERLGMHAGDFEAMQTQWREFLEYLATVADNLVVRLIGNDLKAQFVEQMMSLGINPIMKPATIKQLLNSLKLSLASKDAEMAAVTFQMHFDELRIAVSEAISLKQGSYQKQAV
jgi:GntR family transcriptional repressor for pyruvate dehydrogenase complex